MITARLIKCLETLLIVGMALLTLDVLWGVFSRFILGAQSRWTEELAIFLLVWLSLIGAGLVYGERGHLGVDYFVNKLDPAAGKLAAVCVEVLVLCFACYALIGGGWTLVTTTLTDGSLSPALGWKLGYVYLAVPLAGFLFAFFAIQHAITLYRDGR